MGVDHQIISAIAAGHASTFFWQYGSDRVVSTLRGTRVGDPYGDLLFNVAATVLLAEITAA
eukprot:10904516-Prorocentrum_lima.AAC.1